MTEIVLNETAVGHNLPPYVIAEVGHNHMGDMEVAKRIIFDVAWAGANAVKLQKRDNKALYTKKFYYTPYNSENAYADTYGEHRDHLEFDKAQYEELFGYAAELGLDFFATPFDLPSVDFLERLEVPFYKVASAGAMNFQLLDRVAQTKKPMLISLGGVPKSMLQVISDRVSSINNQIIFLHCVAGYPAKTEFLNLDRITYLKRTFPWIIGFSDHQDGISAGAIAYTLGARVFEKHVTADHSAKGTDHSFSLEAEGLRTYIRYLSHAYVAIKDVDQPLEVEKKPLYKMGYGIHIARDLRAGSIIDASNVVVKSPADGIPAFELDNVMGRILQSNAKEDQPLEWGMLVA